jgi:hypothetical protein
MSEEKIFSGVDALIERMELYPEEFFENGDKRSRWSFMYKDYFRDALTESEKGRMHEAIRKMRRLEFDAPVLKELMKEEVKQAEGSSYIYNPAMTLSSSGALGVGTVSPNIQLGQTTLSEDDLKRIKSATLPQKGLF